MTEPAATYNPALTTPLDRMRDALDDINVDAPFVPDVTYLAYLSDADSDWRLATAAMARKLASRAINSPSSFNVPDEVSVSWGDRAAAWLRVATFYEAEAARLSNGGALWVAEVSRAGMDDTDDAEYSVELRR